MRRIRTIMKRGIHIEPHVGLLAVGGQQHHRQGIKNYRNHQRSGHAFALIGF
jgi:hypothetical protein